VARDGRLEPGSGRQHMRHRGCYDQGRNVPSLNDSRSTASTGWRGGVGLPQQGQGLSTMTARAHCRHGPTIVGTRYLGRLRNSQLRRHSLTQPTRNSLQMLRGENLAKACLWKSRVAPLRAGSHMGSDVERAEDARRGYLATLSDWSERCRGDGRAPHLVITEVPL